MRNKKDKKVFEQMMKEADSNGNGTIGFVEFYSIIKKINFIMIISNIYK